MPARFAFESAPVLKYFSLWLALFVTFHSFVLVFAGPGDPSPGTVILTLLADVAWSVLLGVLMAVLRNRGWQWPVRAGYALLTIFLVVAFGFAQLYQRPFSFAFVRLDTGTIWKENFVSGLYELGFAHLLLAAICTALLYWQSRLPVAMGRHICWVGFSSATLLVLLHWFSPPESHLLSNPLSAAFARRQESAAMVSVQLAENDLVPALESAGLNRVLPQVRVQRVAGRNVILYYLESTPFSVIGKRVQGREVTPNLNRLSERSLFFTRHYANFPLSINAFYNSFCSAYALPDGAWISLVLPDFRIPCLSEILTAEGYRAAALHAGYLGYAKQKRFMQKRGFSLMLDAESLRKPPYEKGMGPWGAADERAMIRPLSEFAAQNREQPFLALLFAFAPHHPYNIPDSFPEVFSGEPGMKKSQVRYLNSLHFADAAFGELLAALERGGLLRNTILVVFGDHGEAFYEHAGNYNHPFFLYEENVHVPMMIWYEGVSPQRVDRVTSHVDILPTVLDLLGKEKLASPLHVGRSMLRGGAASLAHLQAYWQEEFSGIVDARFKYIRKENGQEELFDLAADPGELQNLAQLRPEVTATYRAITARTFAQKKLYYEKYAGYQLVRFNPASQDR